MNLFCFDFDLCAIGAVVDASYFTAVFGRVRVTACRMNAQMPGG